MASTDVKDISMSKEIDCLDAKRKNKEIQEEIKRKQELLKKVKTDCNILWAFLGVGIVALILILIL